MCNISPHCKYTTSKGEKYMFNNFSKILPKELEKWQNKGIISEKQKEEILALYPQSEHNLATILSLLGAILVGVGIILFFAANWDVLSRNVKLLLVITLLISIYSSGYYLTINNKMPNVGYGLLCLGALIFGSAIWLVAQIFNLPANYHSGFFLWFIGLVAPAHLLKSPFTSLVSGISLIAWFIAGNFDLGWYYFIYFLLLLVIFIPFGIQFKSKWIIVLTAIGNLIGVGFLSNKLVENSNFYGNEIILVNMLIIAVIYYILALRTEHSEKYEFLSFPLFIISLLTTLSISFLVSFKGFLNEFVKIDSSQSYFPTLLLAILVVLGAFYLHKKRNFFLKLSLFYFNYITIFTLLISFINTIPNNLNLIIFNINIFVLALFIIILGYNLRNIFIFNLGIFFFGICVISKYFDYFFALLPRSIFFIMGGALLLITSILLERKRRILIKDMR
jgi:uncharacterized membrane protein